MVVTDTHCYFYVNEFSNWNRSKIVHPYRGLKFPTSEHAFMWMKADFFGDSSIASQIPLCPHPRDAKELGRQVKRYDDMEWSLVRYNYMVVVNLWKFLQNEYHRDVLASTGDRILVEASPYDRVWGVGLGENDPLILDEKNWKGDNLLGKALMDVRDLLIPF